MSNTISTKLKVEGEREYKNSIKNITQETKTLDAKLKEVASRFDDETESMEKAQESAELLQKKKEALEKELELMQDRLQEVTDAYGEDSTEALKLEESIAKVETQLNITNGALADNQAELDGVGDSASDAATEMDGIGAAADAASQVFGSSVGSMISIMESDSLIDAIGSIVDLIVGIGEAAVDAADKYQSAFGNIAVGTGMTGEQLEKFGGAAFDLWASFDDATNTIEETSEVVATLNTRFGIGVDQVQDWGTAVLEYAKVSGEDASTAINSVADVMRNWGMETDNSAESLQNAKNILDTLTVAGELCDASVTDLTGVLIEQSGAAQALGMSMDDVIAFMVAYEDAGGDASTVGTALKTAYNNLNDAVNEYNATNVDSQTTVEEAWGEIMSILEESDDMNQALNTTVGNLGITMQDALGTKAAQKLAQGFTIGGASVDTFSSQISSATGEVDRLISSVTTASDKLAGLKRSLASGFTKGADSGTYVDLGEMAFAKAMNQPYLFNGEQNITVGEAGPEVLVGQAYFDNLVARAYSPTAAGGTTNNYNSNPVINVYGAPGQDVNDLARIVEQRIAVTTRRRS